MNLDVRENIVRLVFIMQLELDRNVHKLHVGHDVVFFQIFFKVLFESILSLYFFLSSTNCCTIRRMVLRFAIPKTKSINDLVFPYVWICKYMYMIHIQLHNEIIGIGNLALTLARYLRFICGLPDFNNVTGRFRNWFWYSKTYEWRFWGQ